MRLSQLLGKRIINIYDGEIMGSVGDSDLVVNPETGAIEAIILPCRTDHPFSEKMFLRGDKRVLNIPWDKVCKIGSEVIVVDIAYD